MKYEAIGDRLIVKQIKEENKFGIVIPKSAETEDKAIGEIIMIGGGVPLIMPISIGDIIIYNEFAGEFIPGEEDLLILNSKDVLAKRYV